jgi:glyoxylase-like metal-dependent hydrolase (beta-lactamase superfamily II)
MAIPYLREIAFSYGEVDRLTPLIRRVIARNPTPFTFHGTGTYIIGRGEVAVMDPGPDMPEHIDAILAALEPGETVSHILITHTHNDHSPGAAPLQQRTGAKTFGFGPHGSGRPEGMVEEGGDRNFHPDVRLRDGDVVSGPGWTIKAIHTPGHCSNHLCYRLREERALFTGDHVMGWSTTVVSPPDGDMQAYMRSLGRLIAAEDAILWPTHGPPITDPQPFLKAYLAHRVDREKQVLEVLAGGPKTISDLVDVLYATLDKRLIPAARRNILAHLIALVETARARCDGPPTLESTYRLA